MRAAGPSSGNGAVNKTLNLEIEDIEEGKTEQKQPYHFGKSAFGDAPSPILQIETGDDDVPDPE